MPNPSSTTTVTVTTALPTLAEYVADPSRRQEALEEREALDERFAHVEPPADAITVYAWDEHRDGTVDRAFAGAEWTVTPTIHVSIWGTQTSDGRVTDRHVSVYISNKGFDPGALDAAGSRRFAEALAAAADELDAAC